MVSFVTEKLNLVLDPTFWKVNTFQQANNPFRHRSEYRCYGDTCDNSFVYVWLVALWALSCAHVHWRWRGPRENSRISENRGQRTQTKVSTPRLETQAVTCKPDISGCPPVPDIRDTTCFWSCGSSPLIRVLALVFCSPKQQSTSREEE